MNFRRRLYAAIVLISILLSFAINGCGSNQITKSNDPTRTALERGSAPNSEPDGSDTGPEPEIDTSMVQSAELPEDFPPNFPIPDGAQITSDVSLPGEEDFRVFIALIMPVEEALMYYQRELSANGWTIEEQGDTSRGMEMKLTGSEYSGELLIVGADTGVALDVHLFPSGTGELIPELAGDLGDSTNLGEGGGIYPADFPIPTSFSPLDLNETLRGEGFELAYSYDGMAEMVMIEFNIALMSAGWEIGDMELEGMSGAYVLPFNNPSSGFEGFAYITSNPGQFDLDTGGAVLIALASGKP